MAIAKDNRYKVVGVLLQNDEIKTFGEIFEILPRTRLALDTKIHYDRLGNKERDPEKFSVKDIQKMAKLFDVDEKVLYSFIRVLVNKKRRITSSTGKK